MLKFVKIPPHFRQKIALTTIHKASDTKGSKVQSIIYNYKLLLCSLTRIIILCLYTYNNLAQDLEATPILEYRFLSENTIMIIYTIYVYIYAYTSYTTYTHAHYNLNCIYTLTTNRILLIIYYTNHTYTIYMYLCTPYTLYTMYIYTIYVYIYTFTTHTNCIDTIYTMHTLLTIYK